MPFNVLNDLRLPCVYGNEGVGCCGRTLPVDAHDMPFFTPLHERRTAFICQMDIHTDARVSLSFATHVTVVLNDSRSFLMSLARRLSLLRDVLLLFTH